MDTIAARMISDSDLVRAVEALALVYEANGRSVDEDCVRLTIPQTRQLIALAKANLQGNDTKLPHAKSAGSERDEIAE